MGIIILSINAAHLFSLMLCRLMLSLVQVYSMHYFRIFFYFLLCYLQYSYFFIKKKDNRSSTCYSASYMRQDSRPEVLYSLGSGSPLAWANDTTEHYAAIHCLH